MIALWQYPLQYTTAIFAVVFMLIALEGLPIARKGCDIKAVVVMVVVVTSVVRTELSWL